MPTIRMNDYAFDYVERGFGDPVVLVHGTVSDRRCWDAQLPAFAERFRAVAYSRRYHWPNQPIAEGADYAMTEQADDVRGVVEALGVAPAHLIGHSYGGFLCLLAAIRAPRIVRSLVLMEPPVLPLFASNPPKPTEMLKLFATRPRTGLAVLKFGAGGIGPATAAFARGEIEKGIRIFGGAALGRETYAAMPPERMDQIRANFIAAEFLGSGFAPLMDDEVRGVRTPTLFVTGEHSPPIFRHFTDRLEELMPNTRRITISGASHNMQEGNPAEFNQQVLTFLDGVRTSD